MIAQRVGFAGIAENPALAVQPVTSGNVLLVYVCANTSALTPTDDGSNTGWTLLEHVNAGTQTYLWYRQATAYDQTHLTQIEVNLTSSVLNLSMAMVIADAFAVPVAHASTGVTGFGTSSPTVADLALSGGCAVIAFSGNRTAGSTLMQGGTWSNYYDQDDVYGVGAPRAPWGASEVAGSLSGSVAYRWTAGPDTSTNTQLTGWTGTQTDRSFVIVAFQAAAPAVVYPLARVGGGTSAALTARGWAPGLLAAVTVMASNASSVTPPSGWTRLQNDTTTGVNAVYCKTFTSADTGTETFTCDAGPISVGGYLLANAGNYSGSNGVDASGLNVAAASIVPWAAPSLTPIGAGDYSLVIFQTVANGCQTPTGYTFDTSYYLGGSSSPPGGQLFRRKLSSTAATGAITASNAPNAAAAYVGTHILINGSPIGTQPVQIPIGPAGTGALATGLVISGPPGTPGVPPGFGGGAVLGGTAGLGPVIVHAFSVVPTSAGSAHVTVGPVVVVMLGANIGPNVYPVPGYRNRWRLTLHNRSFAPATLGSTMIAELAEARARKLVQAWNTPATLTFELDGQSQAAGLVAELEHDVVAWRWDDQTGADIPVFRGVISASADTLDEQSHVVAYTCHDYAAVLARRLLTSTYTVTGRDQDNIVGDLLAAASSAATSGGTALTPASYLPLALAAVAGNGTPRGLSGRTRDRTYYGSQNIGTAVDDLAKVQYGFDWDVQPSATDAQDSLRVFYPQQGVTRSGLALQYGSTVSALTRQVDSGSYANYVRVLGNNSSAVPTPQNYAEAATSDAATTPAGLWALADNAAQVTVTTTLAEQAAGALSTYAVLVPSYTLTLSPGAYVWGSPNMGDTVPLIVQSGRLNVNTAVRVLGITYTIGDDGQEDVALTVGRPTPTLADLLDRAALDVKDLALR